MLAFTLVELLTVLAIMSILAALLIPAVNLVRQEVRRSQCMSNLKQINLSIQSYALDWDGAFPPSETGTPTWRSRITDYQDKTANGTGGSAFGRDVNGCPEARKQKNTLASNSTYSMNMNLSPISTSVVRQTTIQKTSLVFLVGDGDFLDSVTGGAVNIRWREIVGSTSAAIPLVPSADQTQDMIPDAPHRGNTRSNLVFVDGHGESRDLADIPLDVAVTPGSTFWRNKF